MIDYEMMRSIDKSEEALGEKNMEIIWMIGKR